MTTALPHGTWPSRLPASVLAAGSRQLGDLVAHGNTLAWTEMRPDEGRQVAVTWGPEHGVRDAGPPSFHARTLVHEYGGAPLVLGAGGLFASSFDDQRLHQLDGVAASAVTPEPTKGRALRYADGVTSPDGAFIVCVREDHTGDGEAVNDLVVVDLATGSVTPVGTGRDFVVAPRLSPDGSRLAWLAWDHPWMPWDAAELWTAEVVDGAVVRDRHVRGGPGDAAVSPHWLPDGRLLCSFDGGGFWEVHLVDDDGVRPLTSFGADVGGPAWHLGSEAVAGLPDGGFVARVTVRGGDRLERVAPDGATTPIDVPHATIGAVVPFGEGVALVGRHADGDASVATWTPHDGVVLVHHLELPLAPGDRAEAVAVEVALPGGDVTHAHLYRPTSADCVGPEDAAPPLVVFVHGGPTAHAAPAFGLGIAYWTTRGFAVVDCNYRGSSGHGRAYRDALRGQWGVLDVEDTIAMARALVQRGEADADGLVIRGGSAGGYTTLAVLTTPGHPFAAGASFFGVADLELLAQHTHKLESRYLDQVVGPLPESAELYRQRSPLHRVDQLSRPLLVLQGLEDEVVPPEQAEAIVAAAAERGIPHAYLAFEGEQHGFRKAENIVTWLESELSFYGQVLGFTPHGDLPVVDLQH